jgi:hypothetical protein
MIARLLFGFLIGFTLAACDMKGQFVSSGFDLTNDQKPTMGPTILCCRCNSNECVVFSGNVCPPGWEQSGGGYKQMQ